MATYYTLETLVELHLIDPNTQTAELQYGTEQAEGGYVVTVKDLAKARAMVAAGKFKWYGPAPS